MLALWSTWLLLAGYPVLTIPPTFAAAVTGGDLCRSRECKLKGWERWEGWEEGLLEGGREDEGLTGRVGSVRLSQAQSGSVRLNLWLWLEP